MPRSKSKKCPDCNQFATKNCICMIELICSICKGKRLKRKIYELYKPTTRCLKCNKNRKNWNPPKSQNESNVNLFKKEKYTYSNRILPYLYEKI